MCMFGRRSIVDFQATVNHTENKNDRTDLWHGIFKQNEFISLYAILIICDQFSSVECLSTDLNNLSNFKILKNRNLSIIRI